MKIPEIINEKWRLCALTFIFGGILVLFSYTYNQNNKHLTFIESIVITQTTTTTTSSKDQPFSSVAENFTPLQDKPVYAELVSTAPLKTIYQLNVTKNVEKEEEPCDFFEGNWVYKPESNPIYNVLQCPFLSLQVSCQKNGRPDSEYEHWSWEAKGKGCEIPRFNGLDMLERLKGKRVIFVGDSLNRNHWESLACLLYSVLPPTRTQVEVSSPMYMMFRSLDYNCIVEFYWSPFLVQLDESKGKGEVILRLDKLDETSKKWEGADIMVFNGGNWWMHSGKIRAWDVFEHGGKLDETMELKSAMEMGLKTWADWVDAKVDRRKTRVFFRSITAAHYGQHGCSGKTMPLTDEEYSKVHFPKLVGETISWVLGKMTFPVKYMNITKLTQFRVDVHPAKYSLKGGVVHYDCSHWCLPGVPDEWNKLLYASLVLDKSVIDHDQNKTDLYLQNSNDTQNHVMQIPELSTTKQVKDKEVEIPNVQILELSNKVQDPKHEKEAQIPDVQSNAQSNEVQGPKQQVYQKKEEECDIFEGKWVYNPDSVPTYFESECPYIPKEFTCQENGRPDSEYVKWIWEPTGCRISKFNGTYFMERLRGKRLAFIGDSISKNQWVSMVCLLYSSLSHSKAKTMASNIFRAEEYNFSVEFHWSSYLVQLEEVNGTNILNLNEISNSAKKWHDADILLFNTGHWWTTHRWDIYRYKGNLIKDMETDFSFKVAMNTWAHWIDSHIDSTKTRVFFRSYSPIHACSKSMKPLDNYRHGSYPKAIYEIVETTIKSMTTEIEYINITKLTQFRADAHPGYYIHKRGRRLLSKQNKDQVTDTDCSHWCLPGLPDTWNFLFYAKLLHKKKSTDKVQNGQQFNGLQNLEQLNSPVLVPTEQLSQPIDTQTKKQLEEPWNLDMPNTPVSLPIEQGAQLSNDVRKENVTDKEECDIFDGRWVYDPQENLYPESTCPFINEQFTCQKNGRQDNEYLNWRWEAKGCQIPKFDGKDMLERLRGKRLIIVGDSINRNQFESLSCLLHSSLPPDQAKVAAYYAHFKAKNYNFSLESYWSPFLIQLQENYVNGSKTLRLDTISDTAENWKGADIMVFNSNHWWTHKPAIRVWDNYEHNGKIVEDMPLESAYKAAMQTWARWIDENVDHSKTKVFFRSMSPVHFGKQTCKAKTEPLTRSIIGISTITDEMNYELEKTIESMKTPVKYLNITRLSQLRIDAHPGNHGRPQRILSSTIRKQLNLEMSNPENIPEKSMSIDTQRLTEIKQAQVVQHDKDCTHWCLPGLPDTWNKLLYASLVLEN
ncbi:hypothetical protein ACFE04_019202 [Oxalis oulophora]